MNDNWVKVTKEFIVKEDTAFRLRVVIRNCKLPEDLNSVEFIQESMKDGIVELASTYNFFMTDNELKILADGLLK
jgi:hypothetical protein